MAFDIKHIPEDLVKAIIDKKAIAFCGAGLSASIVRSNGKNLPTWQNLLKELVQSAIRDRYNFSGLELQIEDAIIKGKLLMVAQELQEVISKPSMSKYLREVFLDRNLKPSPTHKILVEIPFVGILTANYDTLIEGAYTLKSQRQI